MQRVGFRRYVLEVGQQLGVVGWVKNLPDGSVEVFVQGPEDRVTAFLEHIRTPPPPAVVEELIVEETSPQPDLQYFRIKYGPLEEELQEGFGAMHAIFLEYWREFRGYRREFRDFRQEFRDYRQEFRDFRQEFREFAQRTEQHFTQLSKKLDQIDGKLTNVFTTLNDKLTVILETLVRESSETRQMLLEALTLLRQAVEQLLKQSKP